MELVERPLLVQHVDQHGARRHDVDRAVLERREVGRVGDEVPRVVARDRAAVVEQGV
jgi:hypothetical protein